MKKPKLRRSIALILVALSLICSFTRCSKSKSGSSAENTDPSLSISSTNLAEGPFDTPVEITGSGFSTTLSENTVYFNGKQGTVTAATKTKLTAKVPVGAGTGKVSVSVNGKTVNGPVFTYQLSAVVSTIAGNGGVGNTDGNGINASFTAAWGLAIDASDNLYVSDYISGFLRKITPDYEVTTIAGKKPIGGGFMAIDKSGNLYIATVFNLIKVSFSGEVSAIRIGNFKVQQIAGVTVDPTGNIYASDVYTNYIYKMNTAGVWSIFAGNGTEGTKDGKLLEASFDGPVTMVPDNSGNLFVVDEGSNLIRKISPDGIVSTIAGNGTKGAVNGKATDASFNSPSAITIDGSGNLFIADFGNFMIRKITTDGYVNTIAGSGARGYLNGQGRLATFTNPSEIAFDSKGTLYVTDNGKVRKIVMQ